MTSNEKLASSPLRKKTNLIILRRKQTSQGEHYSIVKDAEVNAGAEVSKGPKSIGRKAPDCKLEPHRPSKMPSTNKEKCKRFTKKRRLALEELIMKSKNNPNTLPAIGSEDFFQKYIKDLHCTDVTRENAILWFKSYYAEYMPETQYALQRKTEKETTFSVISRLRREDAELSNSSKEEAAITWETLQKNYTCYMEHYQTKDDGEAVFHRFLARYEKNMDVGGVSTDPSPSV